MRQRKNCLRLLVFLKRFEGLGETAQQLRVLAALAEEPSGFPVSPSGNSQPPVILSPEEPADPEEVLAFMGTPRHTYIF